MCYAFLVDNILTLFTTKMREKHEVCRKIKKEPLKRAAKHNVCIPHLMQNIDFTK